MNLCLNLLNISTTLVASKMCEDVCTTLQANSVSWLTLLGVLLADRCGSSCVVEDVLVILFVLCES